MCLDIKYGDIMDSNTRPRNLSGGRLQILFAILISIAVLILTIGYASFVSTFSITNTVAHFRISANTRVSGVSTSSPYISNLDYTANTLVSSASIPSGATVIYQVTITTYDNQPMALSNITVSNGGTVLSNVSVSPNVSSGSYIKICASGGSCTLNVSKLVDITLTNNTGSTITTNNLSVNLTFTSFYMVTYNGDSIGDVLHNGTFTYSFSSNAPTSVSVVSGTCGSPSISSATLTIPNVTSDLVLSGSSTTSSSGTGTIDDPYQSSGSVYDTSVVQTGYNIFEDAPGAPKVNATVTTNSSGQTVTTINSFEFTSSSSSGVSFGTGASANPVMDTGVLAFNSDNSAFSIHVKFRANLTTNRGKYVLAALSKTGTSTYSGFTLHVLDSSTPTLNISTYINKNYNGQILNPNISLVLTTNGDATSNTENTYEVVLSYDTSYGGQNFKYRCVGDNCKSTSEQSAQKKNVPTGLTDARITIGGNGLNTTNDAVNISILELQICKGQFVDRSSGDYRCAS